MTTTTPRMLISATSYPSRKILVERPEAQRSQKSPAERVQLNFHDPTIPAFHQIDETYELRINIGQQIPDL